MNPAAVDPCSDLRWLALARRSGSVFHSPAWLRTVRDAFGIEVQAHLDDAAETGLVVGRIDDLLGRRSSTFPFTDYCGPLGEPAAGTWRALADPVIDGTEPYRIRARPHDVLDGDERLSEQSRYAWHGVDLRADEDASWARLPSPARQNIRRARRSMVTVGVSSSRRALAEFERLHVALRRHKYRMLAQPPEYFDALALHFGDDLAVMTATVDDATVAAIVLLRWGDTAYYKFNASGPEASPARANDLLMWDAMAFSRDEWGCARLDLGLSDLDQPGLLRYKAKYATDTGEIVAYATRTRGDEDRADAGRSLANRLVEIVTAPDMPDRAAVEASRSLYRLFC